MNRRQALTALTTTGLTGTAGLVFADAAAAYPPPVGTVLTTVLDETRVQHGAISYAAALRVISTGRDDVLGRTAWQVRWGVDIVNHSKDQRTVFYTNTRGIWHRRTGFQHHSDDPERRWTIGGHRSITKWFGGRWAAGQESNFTAAGVLRYGTLPNGNATVAQWQSDGVPT
ncbi:hypothetical protein [Kineococcus sp. SYSU DK003]|uniref:hypothetical protein n=1 Tax=Kineococcus sp. SYSU DK003 TaxID=3383124 RepID=UPI003D7D747F